VLSVDVVVFAARSPKRAGRCALVLPLCPRVPQIGPADTGPVQAVDDCS
jgi:hypothetical protein